MQEEIRWQKVFFRKYALDSYDAASAGTRHTSEINSVAVKTMSQIGIDICFLLSLIMLFGLQFQLLLTNTTVALYRL
jgi:hypothetical protein